ncbi:MAG: nickel-responsive transcriptional regulator NikR [Bacteroidota bacterium]
MEQVERFGVSMPPALLQTFDEAIEQAGYQSRSEAVRDLIRDYLVRQQWERPEAEVVGTITMVYDHHTHELDDTLTELQHEHHESIICSTHVHLDAHNCLEMVAVRGRSAQVREIAQRLLSTRGVKHGGLTATAVGEGL